MLLQNAFVGSLVADAVSMPVHWYYDTGAMDSDYGCITGYVKPRNPHPDSILWRSSYNPASSHINILHHHAEFWGRRNVHYHQFLEAGENTLNLKLAVELYHHVISEGSYKVDTWLSRYIDLMQSPGWNNDTYIEEYHREFFNNLARGRNPRDCGVNDYHIGGLSHVPALMAALEVLGIDNKATLKEHVMSHVSLTHRNRHAASCAASLVNILCAIKAGCHVQESILEFADKHFFTGNLREWSSLPDRSVVGARLTPACYLPQSYTASLYFAWQHSSDFSGGILANANVGGDNCHRGVVVGAILGAANGVPSEWLQGLHSMKQLECDDVSSPSRIKEPE